MAGLGQRMKNWKAEWGRYIKLKPTNADHLLCNILLKFLACDSMQVLKVYKTVINRGSSQVECLHQKEKGKYSWSRLTIKKLLKI